jgi:hypothetical protein
MEAATTATATDAPAEPAEAGSEPTTALDQSVLPNTSTENGDERAPSIDGGERDASGKFLSREAASYRRRLRDTEAERDQLRDQLDRLQRAEVERLAGAAGLQVPGDAWTFGATLDTLRGEDGGIDSEAVSGLVGEIVKDRPGLQARPTGDLGIGRGAGAAGTRTEQTVGLSALLKPERR